MMRLRMILEGAGLRCTPQRLAVYDHLARAEHHPTAEDVYQAVRAAIPRISLATVYKALEALVEIGVAAKLPADAGDGQRPLRRPSRPPLSLPMPAHRARSTTCPPTSTPTSSPSSTPSSPTT